jgi:hypothetical protein
MGRAWPPYMMASLRLTYAYEGIVAGKVTEVLRTAEQSASLALEPRVVLQPKCLRPESSHAVLPTSGSARTDVNVNRFYDFCSTKHPLKIAEVLR